jgi:CRISPR-associated endonuclease Cas2
MRVFVLLNPTNKRGTLTEYSKFRSSLEKMGFQIIIPEVYMRVCTSRKSGKNYIESIKKHAPKSGTIIAVLSDRKTIQETCLHCRIPVKTRKNDWQSI